MSLFGTDGVRGRAGAWPFTPEAMLRLGSGLGQTSRGPVVIGRDTRASGSWIRDALSAGILATGRDVIDLGVTPTPVVARVTARAAKGLGVVISASHNPAQDNGLKILRPNGTKATPALEAKLEAALDVEELLAGEIGGVRHDGAELIEMDRELLLKTFPKLDLAGLRIAIDTAHGAATTLAPELLTPLGADVIQIGGSPDGRNINKNCGSLHLKGLQKAVLQSRADIGFAFDGDADRCLAVAPDGRLLDGDALLAILARDAKSRRRPGADVLIGTVMTNGALEAWLKQRKIRLIRTPVGDKYVVAKMKTRKAAVGGENSGHLVMTRHGLVGDGCQSMLAVLDAMARHNFDVDTVLDGYQEWPQVLINVAVSSKPDLMSVPRIRDAARAMEADLAGEARLLLRYSGTESLCRVMVEGRDPKRVSTAARSLATILEEEIGT